MNILSSPCFRPAQRVFGILLAFLLAFQPGAKGQLGPADPPTAISWLMGVIGERGFDNYQNTVYNGDDPSNPYRHCNNDFLFSTYVEDPTRFTLGVNLPAGHALKDVEWQLIEDGVVTYPAGGGYATIKEYDEITRTFHTAGYKYLKFRVDFSGTYAYLTAKVLAMKHVQEIGVELTDGEICALSYPSGTDYRFKVLADIPYVDILGSATPDQHWHYFSPPGISGYCEEVPDFSIKLGVDFDSYYADYPLVSSEFVSWASSHTLFELGGPGALWVYPATLWPDVEKFYLDYTNLAPYITDADQALTGTVTYDDGVSAQRSGRFFFPIKNTSTTTNYNNAGAFFVSEYDKTSPGFVSMHTSEPFGTIDAPSHETWTPTDNPMVNEGFGNNIPLLRIKDKLVIGPGQSLTIKDMTIEMGKDAQIIVESDPAGVQEAGRLVLDNATIRAYRDCGNENNFWNGIILQGNNSKAQDPIAGDFNKRYQAMLYMSYGATIAQAKVGVKTYDPAAMATRAGGIIIAFNSHFDNNQLAIDMAAYTNKTGTGTKAYLGNLNNCSFYANDPILPTCFTGFVQAEGIKGLQANSCHFEADFGAAMIGFGIRSTDATVAVRPVGSTMGGGTSYFKGLFEALDVRRASSLAEAGLQAYNSQFVHNYTGIHTAAVQNPSIAYNSMQVPERPMPAYYGRNCSGVNIETGSGYRVSSNSFATISGGTTHTGTNAVLVWNSGSAPNTITHNTVGNMEQGMIANYINRNLSTFAPQGLQFLCNSQHADVGTCIAALGANSGTDGIAANQGSNSQPAGNTFAHQLYDIYNPVAEVGAVNYYYNSFPNAEPTSLAGAVSKYLSTASDGCSGTTLPSDPPMPRPTTGLSGGPLRASLLASIDYYATDYEATDRLTQLHSLLGQLQDPYADLERADLYIAYADYTAANTLYNGIVAERSLSAAEAYEFSHWGRMLMDLSLALGQSNRSARELNSSEQAILLSVADSATMWAKVRAQNWLVYYDTTKRVNTFLYPPVQAAPQRKVEDGAMATGTRENRLYPNPAGQYIDLHYSVENEKGIAPVFELRDLSGRLVYSYELSDAADQRIELAQLAPALYLYTVSEDGKVKMQGKLSKY